MLKASGQTFNFNCSGKMDTFQVRSTSPFPLSSSSTRADFFALPSVFVVRRNNPELDSPSNELLPLTLLRLPSRSRRRSGRTGWLARYTFDASLFSPFCHSFCFFFFCGLVLASLCFPFRLRVILLLFFSSPSCRCDAFSLSLSLLSRLVHDLSSKALLLEPKSLKPLSQLSILLVPV